MIVLTVLVIHVKYCNRLLSGILEFFSGYSFLIRDYTNLCIQAKVDFANLKTTLLNVNGIEMLKIIKTDPNVVNVKMS